MPPDEHGVQFDARLRPATPEYVPAGHTTGAVARYGQYVPATHTPETAVMPVAPQYEPFVHARQAESALSPVTNENVPAEHGICVAVVDAAGQ